MKISLQMLSFYYHLLFFVNVKHVVVNIGFPCTYTGLQWAMPLFAVVRDDVMVSQPDTRVIAKAWIEAHVPAGARILMDGMRFRFVQGAPLTPDARTVERRLTGLASCL